MGRNSGECSLQVRATQGETTNDGTYSIVGNSQVTGQSKTHPILHKIKVQLNDERHIRFREAYFRGYLLDRS